MSRAPRNGASAGGRIAVLHAQGARWVLLVAERRATLAVVEARSFGHGQEAEVLAALSGASISVLIQIAPGDQTIARAAEIPSGPHEEMTAAGALLTEGTLPDDIPAHRRAAGLTPDSGRSTRAAATMLLTAWRSGAHPDTGVSWPNQRWTTEIAALAFLCAGRGAGVYAPSGSGSVSIFATGPSRTVARVLVESPADPAQWRAARLRALTETCAAVGIPVPALDGPRAGQALTLSPDALESLRTAVTGAALDPAWLDTYGIALGAALVATSPDPLARRLAELRADAPTSKTPSPERLAAWMARPRNAAAVTAIAAVLMLLVPLGLAGARLAVLNSKAGALPDQDKARDQIEKRAALYRELDQTRWPMTKLWADISAAVPQGVSAEALSLSADQGLTIKGTAESTELLSTLQKNLNSTGLFGNVKFPRSESTPSGVSFDLSASVVVPHTPVRPVDDFAARPLAVRLYGEGATSSGGADDQRSPSPGPEGARGERRGNFRTGRGEDPPGPRPSKALDVPAALTDEQVAAMDRTTAMKEWTYRQRVSQTAGIDAGVKSRLEGEVVKLKERMRQAGTGGGS